MSEVGKMSKSIKGGGYLFLALDIYNAGDAIANAKSEEKVRTTVVESSKIAGGLGAGAVFYCCRSCNRRNRLGCSRCCRWCWRFSKLGI